MDEDEECVCRNGLGGRDEERSPREETGLGRSRARGGDRLSQILRVVPASGSARYLQYALCAEAEHKHRYYSVVPRHENLAMFLT